MSKRPFDGFEVHLVAERHTDDPEVGDWCETVDTPEELVRAREDGAKLFYTVYGYRGWGDDPFSLLPDGGAEAISDFNKYTDAIDTAYALADGKNVEDMVVDQSIGLNA